MNTPNPPSVNWRTHLSLGLLALVYIFSYIDRQVISILIEPIKHDFGASDTHLGLLTGIAFGLSVAGLNLLPWPIVAGLVAVGTISMILYVMHARRTGSPVLDFSLLRLSTMRASIIGGFLFRLGIGALPSFLTRSDVESGAVVPVLPKWTKEAGSLFFVHPRTQHVPRKVTAFRDFLLEHLRHHPLCPDAP